jgi:hypothetical protein
VDVVDRQLGKVDAVKCLVNKYAVCLAIDSSARVSILNKASVDKLHLRVTRPCKELSLKSYNGTVIDTLGVVIPSVRCGDVELAQFTSDVVQSGANIMGKDLFDVLGFRLSILPSHGVDTCVLCSGSVVSSVVPCTEHRFRTELAELFKAPEIITSFVHKPQVDTSAQHRVQALRRVPLA